MEILILSTEINVLEHSASYLAKKNSNTDILAAFNYGNVNPQKIIVFLHLFLIFTLICIHVNLKLTNVQEIIVQVI